MEMFVSFERWITIRGRVPNGLSSRDSSFDSLYHYVSGLPPKLEWHE